MKNGISRRDFVKYVGIAGAAAGIAGPMAFSRNAFGGESITVHSWGGSVSDALRKYAFEPFSKATGIEVIDGVFTGLDAFLAQVKASFPPGGEFNIAHLSGIFEYAKYKNLGFDVELDESKIPNISNVADATLNPLRRITNGKLSGIPYDYGQTGIAYNNKFISKEKAEKLGAALLWDKELKGKLGSIGGDHMTNIWYAALYTGQNPNDITKMNDVWDALKEQRSLIKKYWESGSELMSLLANGDIYATVAWSGRVASLQKEGHPIGYLAPKNTYSWMEYMYVIKGTDLDTAYKLLNFMLEPNAAIEVAKGQNYPPSLDPSKVSMPDEIKKLPAFDPTGKLDGYLFAEPEYWNSHQVEWAEKWDKIKAGS